MHLICYSASFQRNYFLVEEKFLSFEAGCVHRGPFVNFKRKKMSAGFKVRIFWLNWLEIFFHRLWSGGEAVLLQWLRLHVQNISGFAFSQRKTVFLLSCSHAYSMPQHVVIIAKIWKNGTAGAACHFASGIKIVCGIEWTQPPIFILFFHNV